jgi:hypothetical protein
VEDDVCGIIFFDCREAGGGVALVEDREEDAMVERLNGV